MPVRPNGFFQRPAPPSYPAKPAPSSPLMRGRAWQMPPQHSALRPEASPHRNLFCLLSSFASMAAVIAVPPERFACHLTSTASMSAKAATAIKDQLGSTANIAATIRDPNAGSSGNDSFTTVLLHGDGTNGSTAIVDSNVGGSPHTWTCLGNAKLSTAQAKFGSASLLTTAVQDFGGHAFKTPDSPDWHFGAGDFTIDHWYKSMVANTGDIVYPFWWGVLDNPSFFTALNRNFFNRMTTAIKVGSTVYEINGAANIGADTAWHHYALVRTGNKIKVFMDGVQDAADVTVSGSVPNNAQNFCVGNALANINNGADFPCNGWIDEFRVSKGIARWTSNFTPPTAPYS